MRIGQMIWDKLAAVAVAGIMSQIDMAVLRLMSSGRWAAACMVPAEKS